MHGHKSYLLNHMAKNMLSQYGGSQPTTISFQFIKKLYLDLFSR